MKDVSIFEQILYGLLMGLYLILALVYLQDPVYVFLTPLCVIQAALWGSLLVISAE